MMPGMAGPSNSEYSAGNTSAIGLTFEKLSRSPSSLSSEGLPSWCSVVMMPVW